MRDRGQIGVILLVAFLVVTIGVLGILALSGAFSGGDDGSTGPADPTQTPGTGQGTPTPTTAPSDGGDGTTERPSDPSPTPTEPLLTTTTPPPTTTTTTPDQVFEPDALRTELHREINEVRDEKAVGTLDYDPELQTVADFHSRRMVEYEFFDHRDFEGLDPRDRYDRFNYGCRIETEDGGVVMSGEVIYRQTFEGPRYPESEMAATAVEEMLANEEKRRTLLHGFWRKQGVGIDHQVGNQAKIVYVTINFC